MAFKTSKFLTLTANSEAIVDLAESGNKALWPAFVTIINRGVTIGGTESANVAAEIAVAIERVIGASSLDEETATFPLTAVPTNGAYLVPARLGFMLPIAVGAFADGANLRVHLYSTGASMVGIVAEG